MAPAGLSPPVAAPQKSFGYPFTRRWSFLLLAVANVPVIYLALRVPLLDPGLEWVVYVLCANIFVGPLAIQMVRLSRNMDVTVSEAAISGKSFFGRQVTLGWDEIRKVVKVLMPLRGGTIVVFPRSGETRITFGESISGLEELLAIIRQRAQGSELKL